MSFSNFKRIKRDIQEIEKSNEFVLLINNDDLSNFECIIYGTEGTPYETGKFVLKVRLPEEYPLERPQIKFKTKIWHPNISSVSGCICLNILSENWTPMLSLESVLVSIKALLSLPKPEDPQDAIVAEQYLLDRELFEETVRFWTKEFANGEKEEQRLEHKVQVLTNMGFPRLKSILTLSYNFWDVEIGINDLDAEQ